MWSWAAPTRPLTISSAATFSATAGQEPQIVITMPILVGLDGVQKMSKSKGNYIGVTDEPKDMFGKVMSISDEMMPNYFTLLTDFAPEKIAELTDGNKTHPKQAKVLLGKDDH